MPRGQPDYGAYQVKRVTATLADMGDLAVRLGSIVEYDRRGDIVCLDDFEEPVLKWDGFAVGGGAWGLDGTIVKSGSQALKLTVGALLGVDTWITRSFVVLGTLSIGIEISVGQLPVGLDFYFSIAYWDGTAGRLARIWFDHSVTSFYVEDTIAGAWTLIANVGALRPGDYMFYPVKLVADFTTNFYKRFLFAGTEHNLKAVVIPPVVLAGGEFLRARFHAENASGVSQSVWGDDFILTQNEP